VTAVSVLADTNGRRDNDATAVVRSFFTPGQAEPAGEYAQAANLRAAIVVIERLLLEAQFAHRRWRR
jgi:hypothetical protein